MVLNFGMDLRMERKEAYRILGISNHDSMTDIRRKYHKLMMIHHPDAQGGYDLIVSQQINEAYRFLREVLEKDGIIEDAASWNAGLNPDAFCGRSIFVDYSFLDKRIPIREVASGKYLWDPYLEEFRMLARSVAVATGDLVQEYACDGNDAILFHLLMQEFVDPAACARKLGRAVPDADGEYEFEGAVGLSDRTLMQQIEERNGEWRLYGRERANRVVIYDGEGTIYGNLSFEDDSYYYVVNPIIASHPDQVRITAGTLHRDRRDLNYAGKLDLKVRLILDETVRTRPMQNGVKIREILREGLK